MKCDELMNSDSFKMAASSSNEVDDELSDEISSKSSLLKKSFLLDEDDDKRGVLTSKKATVNQVKSEDESDELVNITDGAFETILKEASTPLYSKSSKNVLLQKVINETNFDEPFSTGSTGKFPPCYRESRRHLERRLRQDYETNTAASRTTQGGSLQNLHRKPPEGKKVLRKSGSLNAFPAGSDDTPELTALKNLLAATTAVSCESPQPPSKERFLVPLVHLLDHESSCNDREESSNNHQHHGHRRNRSMSECLGVVRDLVETDEESVNPIAVVEDGNGGVESNDATILNCVKTTSESDETSEEVEMMDVDHSSEETKSSETSPLLLKADSSNEVRWSTTLASLQTSCIERGFAELKTSRCFGRVSEADDKVDFPLVTPSRGGEYQHQNGQSLSEIGFGGAGIKGSSRKNMISTTNHHQAVARLVGGSEGDNHVVATSDGNIYDRKKPESELKICGLQRPLDENGNPLIYHQEGGGLGTYRSTAACYPSQFTHQHQHRDTTDLNLGGLETNPRLRKQKKARQNSKQKVIKAEQIDGHFGALDIEMIMKRINSEDEENVVSLDSRAKRISQKDGNRHLVTKAKKPSFERGGGNKDNNKRNLENRIDSDPTPNGHRLENNSIPADGDDAGTHQERSNVRSKPSKVRKQEFQKRSGGGGGGGGGGGSGVGGGAGGINGSSDGGSSNKTSFEGDSSSNATKSPERNDVASSVVDSKIEKTTVEDTNAVVDKVSSFVADFYAVTDIPGSVDEREFHEVRKKKKKRKQQSFQVTKGEGGGPYSHRVRDQGGGSSFGNSGSQSSRGGVAGGIRGVGDVGVLWPDLSSLTSRRHADDVRRKSAGSVPPSEHSSEDNSDVESVHSLPVSSMSPKTSVGKTSNSSSCTPQTSYADIARMSAAPTMTPKGNFSLSVSSMSSLGHSESNNNNTKRDAFTSTSVDKFLLLSPRSADEMPSTSEPSLSDTGESQCAGEEECIVIVDDNNVMPNSAAAAVTISSSSSVATEVSFGCDRLASVACDRSSTTEKPPQDSKISRPPLSCAVENVSGSIVFDKGPSVENVQSTIDDVVVVNLPSTASSFKTTSSSKGKFTNQSKLCNSKSSSSRPVVIFAGDLGSPVELNEVTFGFEVNEQLLRDSAAAEQTVLAPFLPTKVDVSGGGSVVVPVSFGTVTTMPSSVVDRNRRHHHHHRPLTTCSDDDDSIIASGSITSFHSHDCSPISERTLNLGTMSTIGNACDVSHQTSSSEVHNFNYDKVVDYIRLEAGRRISSGGSSVDRSQIKIQYYKRAE